MKRSRLRTLVLSATLAVAGVGCYDVFGIVPDYFSLRIIPPEPGGGYAAVPGGEIIATLRVQNGLRVRTDIKFVVSTPPHVTARVEGSNDTESVPDLELGPEEARDLDVVINVGPDQPEGPFTVEISAEGESVLATNPDGRSYMDVQTAQVEVQVITDELPPTVTIHDPAPNSIFTRLPIQVSATASDDGSVTSVSSTLNGGPPRELFPERSSDAPRPSIDVEFGIPERYDSGTFLDFGRNVLDVQARDASGLTGSAQVEFTYAPTGLCTNLEIVPQRSSFTAAPGDTVGIKVRVAPVGGWSDPVDVRARLPGFATGSIPVRINDLQEPAEVLVKAGLSEDIAPGGDYHVFVWAEDVGSRDIVCEAAIPLTVVAPGVGAPPSVTIDSPPTGLVTADRNLALSATVTDDANLSEVFYLNWSDHPRDYVDVRTGVIPAPFSFTETIPLVEGPNDVRVFAIDVEGRYDMSHIWVTYEPGSGGGRCSQFTLAATPDELVLAPGDSASLEIGITRLGAFTGAVELNMPETFASRFFSSISFTPNPTSANSTLAVTVANTAEAVEWRGSLFQFRIDGIGGSTECATTFTVQVPQ